MRYNVMVEYLTKVQDYYNTSPGKPIADRYEHLDILFMEVTEPKVTHKEWNHIDTLLTQNFGSGEWAGDDWNTYVNQWEQEHKQGDIDEDTLKDYIYTSLEWTINALAAEKEYDNHYDPEVEEYPCRKCEWTVKPWYIICEACGDPEPHKPPPPTMYFCTLCGYESPDQYDVETCCTADDEQTIQDEALADLEDEKRSQHETRKDPQP